VATADRYEKIRKTCDDVKMEVRRNKRRIKIRSYLSEILDIVVATGRRISAVLQLRYDDLRLNEGPHGSIRWPADTDKQGKEWLVPMNALARAAVDGVLRDRRDCQVICVNGFRNHTGTRPSKTIDR
jgi:integrase